MPIAGLTQVRRLPRLGKIRMGVKVKRTSQSGKEIEVPQKTDHFVVPPEVATVYGDKPRSLDILIPVEDEEKWAPQYYKCYSLTQGLVCRGDGCAATRLVDTTTGDRAHKDTRTAVKTEMECRGRQCGDYLAKACKEVMSLQFILYKVPGFGIWQIDTSSINSIININSCADYIRAMFGKIALIPLQLTIEPKQVQNPESGKRQTVYVLNLRNNMTLLNMVESTKKFQAQLPGGRLALPPADEDTVEVGDLAEDGQEPETPETVVEKETGQSESPTAESQSTGEASITWDKLESAAPKQETKQPPAPDDPWEYGKVFQVIQALRKKQVKQVLGQDFANRMNKDFKVDLPAGTQPNLKTVYELLTRDKKQVFCNWIADLEAMAN